jgi:hypothetical protein
MQQRFLLLHIDIIKLETIKENCQYTKLWKRLKNGVIILNKCKIFC